MKKIRAKIIAIYSILTNRFHIVITSKTGERVNILVCATANMLNEFGGQKMHEELQADEAVKEVKNLLNKIK